MTRHNHKRGFNLIEAAIVLGVVGLVIGGIWVAAASLKQRWFEQQFMEGLLVLAQNAQKYLSERNDCNVVVFSGPYPELWDIMYPKQWEQAGVDERYPHSPYLMCAGDVSPQFPNQKTLWLTFWNSTDRYVCNNLMVKIQNTCKGILCDIPYKDYTCAQPDGTDWGIAFPVGR